LFLSDWRNEHGTLGSGGYRILQDNL